MHKTLQALISETEKVLYQSAGPGVQVYAEDILATKLNHGFTHCYRSEWWPQFKKREVRELDGATGLVTAPFTYITAWEDVQHVFRRYSSRPLPILPGSLSTLDMTGTEALYIEATGDTDLFTVYPLTAEGTIEVVGRRTYGEFALADIVPFDHLALVHFAAWSYFTDDGSNPAAAMKHQGLFESHMKRLRDDAFSGAIALDGRAGDIPQRWY